MSSEGLQLLVYVPGGGAMNSVAMHTIAQAE
jgi:hypothetical protein